MDNILKTACQLDVTKNRGKRDKIITILTNQMDRLIDLRGDYTQEREGINRFIDILMCKRLNGYMILLYLIAKALYFVNIVMQLFALSYILQTDFNMFGFSFFDNIDETEYFINSPIFPKVTMCDFHIRILGNVQRYTVQCVLPINLYIEKIYVIIYFWMLFVGTMTVLSFLMWLIRGVFGFDRERFVLNHIPTKEHDRIDMEGRPLAEDFVSSYLRQDGLFILRLISHNTNNLTTSEIITGLYVLWQRKEKIQSRLPKASAPGDDDTDDSISKELL